MSGFVSERNSYRSSRSSHENRKPALPGRSQLIRISPETYRAVAPAIRDGHLHHEGDPIALVPENTGKIAAAVRNLRPKPAPSQPDPFTSLQQLSDRFVKAFSQLAASGRNPHRVAELLTMLLTRLERIGRDL